MPLSRRCRSDRYGFRRNCMVSVLPRSKFRTVKSLDEVAYRKDRTERLFAATSLLELGLFYEREDKLEIVEQKARLIMATVHEEILRDAGRRLAMHVLEDLGIPKDCRLIIRSFRDGPSLGRNFFKVAFLKEQC